VAGPGQFTVNAVEADRKALTLFEERPSRFLAPTGEDANRHLIEARIRGIREPALIALWLQVEKGRQHPGARQGVLDLLNDRRAEITGGN
jgi:hypothetical protein